jgi:osmotically-inducible protein OsmY
MLAKGRCPKKLNPVPGIPMPAKTSYPSFIVVALAVTMSGCSPRDENASASPSDAGRTAVSEAAGAVTPTPQQNDLDDRVEASLRSDSVLAAFRLDADDENGRLELEGTVATEAQKTRAGEIAARVAPGVSIDNRVRVAAAAARRDSARAAADEADDRVEDALEADTELRAFDLDADDDDGRIVLTGRVRTAAQRGQAEAIAKRLAPGIAIDNRIRVE